MIQKPASICALLCLLLSACGTPAQKQQTPHVIERPRPVCVSLIPCRLPGRLALQSNEDWDRALSQTEGALLQCATQVLDCINKQQAVDHAAAR
jgi:hypothetical protein